MRGEGQGVRRVRQLALVFIVLASVGLGVVLVHYSGKANPAGDNAPVSAAAAAPTGPARWYSADFVAAGEPLYRQYCASCHGPDGEGAGNWRQRDADGNMPPPPLNGTGHMWHHPAVALMQVILEGSPGGQGNMPAWRGVLTEEQVANVIAYLQDKWTDEIYAEWHGIELRSRGS